MRAKTDRFLVASMTMVAILAISASFTCPAQNAPTVLGIAAGAIAAIRLSISIESIRR